MKGGLYMEMNVNAVTSCQSANDVKQTASEKDLKRKKVTAAVASAMQPGAGQLINGDYKKAIKHYLISIPIYRKDDFINSTFDTFWRARSAYDAYKSAEIKDQEKQYKNAG